MSKYNFKIDLDEARKLYNNGYSCGQIAVMLGVSRQAVWEKLKNNNVKLRKKKLLPYIIYDDIKFTISSNGYYRATRRDKHISLHRYKYEKEVGKIPSGYDIHHKDFNKINNNIENLECLSKSDHTRLYSPSHNQYKNYKTIVEGKYENNKI